MKEFNPITLATPCKNCGKSKGNHQSRTGACPQGKKTKIGYTSYSNDSQFTPVFKLKLGDKIRIKTTRINLVTDIERISKGIAYAGEFAFRQTTFPPTLVGDVDWANTQYGMQPTFTLIPKDTPTGLS